MQYEFRIDGETVEVTLAKNGDLWTLSENNASILPDGRIRLESKEGTTFFAHSAKVKDTWWIHIGGHTFCIDHVEPGAAEDDEGSGLSAPMPGKVLQVLVEVGQKVEPGQPLMILEAMKMEHRIIASQEGTVSAINFSEGDQVQQGSALLELSL
ncbi:MAG: biotin/lipoyl-binding protein [Euryarchaeota archaeon]|jgi:biotin carboxyl carrier protein|nr:biotin/lipoyl-binding protein [Euryarchaeota archaeon]MBT4924373.1 biotin/lipoyl-binding protein [Euryarchaeota archaeon]MBT5736352.1 biotin/lipoyl-binding protein [Euryarchaeota archaeon]MBT7460668.1 biotin/lipoyl-binding protein [Euryarchaeota archaeon]